MPHPTDARRRWFGLLLLGVAAGMLIWGETILKPVLSGWMFMAYWGLCFLITFATILVALIDIRAVRRRTREEQRRLIERTLDGLEEGERGPRDASGQAGDGRA
jgi:MFS family permease